MRLESRRLGQASARDSNISRAGPGAVAPARPGRAPLARVGSTRKNRWVWNIGFYCIYLKISRNVTFGFFRSNWNVMDRDLLSCPESHESCFFNGSLGTALKHAWYILLLSLLPSETPRQWTINSGNSSIFKQVRICLLIASIYVARKFPYLSPQPCIKW